MIAVFCIFIQKMLDVYSNLKLFSTQNLEFPMDEKILVF